MSIETRAGRHRDCRPTRCGRSNTETEWVSVVDISEQRAELPLPPTDLGETLDATQLAAVFDAFSDPTRVKLLQFVLAEEHCVTQCTEHTGLTQSAVSKHLAKLTDAGLVARRPEGRRAYYRAIKPAAVSQILANAQSLGGDAPAD